MSNAIVSTAYEAPITFNTAVLFGEQHSRFDEQAEAMRQRILNAEDQIKPSVDGVTYYVSHKGDDTNDGRTPETAWRSTHHLREIAGELEMGSTILFERGGVYRGTMYMRTGMRIGAYGVGPKPQLYGSHHNYADEKFWKKTDEENVWLLETGEEQGDVGNITFDYGVINASTSRRLFRDQVVEDFDYYYDPEQHAVYFYHSAGNPGGMYKSIEVTARGTGAILRRYVPDGTTNDVVIDNLCMRYANFAVSNAACENMTVTNCEIGYIGGCMHTERIRLGNGIEFFGNQKNTTVRNNWIYQCYDAGYTDQGGRLHEIVQVSDNLVEYCHYNFEVFVDKDGAVKDSVYENNILRFPGYGFGSYNRRAYYERYSGRETKIGGNEAGNIRTGWKGCSSDHFIIRNNIFDGGRYNIVYSPCYDGVNGPTFVGNTWAQKPGGPTVSYPTGENGCEIPAPYGTLEAMQEAILPVDPTAILICE